MDLTLHIPDALAASMASTGDLPRRLLEAAAAEEYRVGRLTRAELREVLELPSIAALDGFLAARNVEGSAVGLIDADQGAAHPATDIPAQIREMRRGVTLDGLRIKDLLNEGRR